MLLLLQLAPPAIVASINPFKMLQSRKTAKPHNDNVNTVKNYTQPGQTQEKPNTKIFAQV
jgi:hypothetical protein